MAIEEAKLYTARCDIPDCDTRLTSGDYSLFHKNGWREVTLESEESLLCPFHTKELRKFLHDNSDASTK